MLAAHVAIHHTLFVKRFVKIVVLSKRHVEYNQQCKSFVCNKTNVFCVCEVWRGERYVARVRKKIRQLHSMMHNKQDTPRQM